MSFLIRYISGAALRLGASFIAVTLVSLVFAIHANAGTYPMYQCISGHPAVAPGWGVFSAQTNASTVLRNNCSSGGAIEDYVFSHGEPGAVEEDGSNGSQVGLGVTVPGSAPDVSIASISALVQVSSVTGDDAFFGFTSAGQELPGAGEVHNGQGGFAANDSWTLPSGARNFDTFVNCTTDGSQTNCHFAESTHVPALSNITLTLIDTTPPSLGSISGSLASAAAHGSTVSGSQTLGFTGQDADSGVLSTTLTLTPQGTGSTYTKTISFASQCTYESWNACPLSQNVSPFAVPTATLKDGTYAVTLSVTDAASNVTSQSLGTITTDNAPVLSSEPTISGTAAVGKTLTAVPGSATSNPEAGATKSSGQWLRCDSSAANCVAIAGATGTAYNLTSEDRGYTIGYEETVANNDGSSSGHSAALGPVAAGAAEIEKAEKEKAEKEKVERERIEREKDGTGGSGSSSSGVTVNVGGGSSSSAGSNQGVVLLGSGVKWRVSLRVSPLRVRRRTRIRLSGVVSTAPRPSEGKLIFLQARSVGVVYGGSGRRRHRVVVFGKWVTFQEFRAKGDGTFSSSYTFKLGGRHTYQFLAVAPAEGQFRNPTGTSSTITVKEV